jgi:hypothetical protein
VRKWSKVVVGSGGGGGGNNNSSSIEPPRSMCVCAAAVRARVEAARELAHAARLVLIITEILQELEQQLQLLCKAAHRVDTNPVQKQ